MLVSFLVRTIVELHKNEPIAVSTVGLANFNAYSLNYVPAQIIRRVSMTTFLNIDIGQNGSQPNAPIYTPILVHAFSTSKSRTQEPYIQTEVLNTLQTFGLIGKEKKIIVVLDPYVVKPTELDLLARTYQHFGAIDIIYVLVKVDELVIIRLNDMATEFVMLSTVARVDELFPDRLTNLSGRPYKVVCFENSPLSFRSPSSGNKTIGIDVEFIDMIAKHQHTVVEYRYTEKPIIPFDPWHTTAVDFANYRITLKAPEQDVALLFLPDQHRWCLAVPKTYNRILHQQMLWPYTGDVWALIVALFVGFFLYNLYLKRILQQYVPNAFPIVNTPLHIFRMFMLFLLTEYYTAQLSSNLGLSLLPAYPRTFEQFQKSRVPIIVRSPESYHFIRNDPEIMTRTVRWNLSERYNPAGFAVLQLCDLFPYTIRTTTRLLGKELSRHHYHLIEQPVQASTCTHSQESAPSACVLISFLVRIITELHCNRSSSSTVGLVNFNTPHNFHYIPAQVMRQVPTVTFVNVDLREDSPPLQLFNTHIVIHAIPSYARIKNKMSIVAESLELLQNFALF
uniref:Ionotropic glutamate receptor L-glutamate and glycine-binding domain-containing protein n=1 Tax=Anopheles maculatus TaxID=74869 RepID=A0A182SKE9_9DIPT